MANFREKPKMNYSALKKEISRDGPGRLYILWGPEDYLIADFTETLRLACLEGGTGEFDAKRLDGPVPDGRDVEEALDAMPFFGGRTFLELRGFDVNKARDERLIKALADVPEWCTVVITLPAGASPDGRLSFVKQLKATGKALEFTAQEQDLLVKWMVRRFASAGKQADREALDRLTFLSGELMNRLIPEIDKICAYTKGERVTVREVEAVAHHIPEADAFEMTNCIANRDFDGAAHYLSELLAGDAEPVEILGVIGWQIRQLYGAKIAMETGRGTAYAKELLGISNDYRLRKLMKTAENFTLRALTSDVRLVAEYCMRTREQGTALTETEALKELLIRFAMESRHA